MNRKVKPRTDVVGHPLKLGDVVVTVGRQHQKLELAKIRKFTDTGVHVCRLTTNETLWYTWFPNHKSHKTFNQIVWIDPLSPVLQTLFFDKLME